MLEQKISQLRTFSSLHKTYLTRVVESIVNHYKENLIGLAVFGSYARKENRLNSDFDLLILLKKGPGRRERLNEFITQIEMKHESVAQELYEREEMICDLSPIILTQEEALTFQAIYPDMVDHCIILHDPEGLIQRILTSTKNLLEKMGAKKILRNNSWEWQFSRFLGGVPL
ncbi:nucleotidyltransferase domain-containing protein [Thermicanus aegyptius]|uniref:nucleotidyltransferase domain-containing protein n=1 Tax=Thermicanus aegyptius TaxID=94009 RepID=UPI000587CFF5|nr:nucleotidyltransferase domain-containing protein [Thermicanus aegyptius]